MNISPVKVWRNQKYVARHIGIVGTIVSWTIVRVPPGGFSDQAPYPVVLVALDDGQHIMAQFVDSLPEDLVKGKRVITVVRRVVHTTEDGVIPYGIKVRPLW